MAMFKIDKNTTKVVKDINGNSHTVSKVSFLSATIPNINAKDARSGGYVESINNLQSEGSCVILNDAICMGDARIIDSAIVRGRGMIFGSKSCISEQAQVMSKEIEDEQSALSNTEFNIFNSIVRGNAYIVDCDIYNSRLSSGLFQNCVIKNCEITGRAEIGSDLLGKGYIENIVSSSELWFHGDFFIMGREDFCYYSDDDLMVSCYWDIACMKVKIAIRKASYGVYSQNNRVGRFMFSDDLENPYAKSFFGISDDVLKIITMNIKSRLADKIRLKIGDKILKLVYLNSNMNISGFSENKDNDLVLAYLDDKFLASCLVNEMDKIASMIKEMSIYKDLKGVTWRVDRFLEGFPSAIISLRNNILFFENKTNQHVAVIEKTSNEDSLDDSIGGDTFKNSESDDWVF